MHAGKRPDDITSWVACYKSDTAKYYVYELFTECDDAGSHLCFHAHIWSFLFPVPLFAVSSLVSVCVSLLLIRFCSSSFDFLVSPTSGIVHLTCTP